MNRGRMLGALGAGLLGAGTERGGTAAAAPDLESALERFSAVDWQRHAVMTKPPGGEPPWKLRLEAEYQAARAGRAAAPLLLRSAGHASPHVRGLAAQMLGVLGDAAGRDRLLAMTASDSSSLARCYAVEALSRLEGAPADAAVVDAVEAARKDASGNVRFSAQQAALRLEKRVPAGAPLRGEWARGYDPARLAAAKPGSPAPAFALTADDGRRVRLADFRGRQSLVILFQLADW